MARPVDPKRREEILEAAVKFLSRSGLGNVSMRTLAAALDVTAPTLLYYFGSKENLIIEVLDAVEAGELSAVDDDSGDLASKARRYWAERTKPADLERFRLQLEAVCLSAAEDALPAPVRSRICTRWVDAIQKDLEALVPQIIDRPENEIRLMMEMLVRSYDPCISCSTHLLEIKFV